MARVKVVMGFVILAASLKYLASLDQVLRWGLLTRERFLAIWIVLFAMAGLYLLGFLRLEGIKAGRPNGAGPAADGHGLPDVRHQPGAGDVRREAGRAGRVRPAAGGQRRCGRQPAPRAPWCG